MEDYYEINKPDAIDIAMAGVRATMNLIPGASFFDQYWSTFLSTPLEIRRAEWFQELYERVKLLEENTELDVSRLNENPAFVDALLQVTPLVQAASSEVKRKAYKDMLTNIALDRCPAETKRRRFFRYIDEFAVDHIILVQFLKNPEKWLLERNFDLKDGGRMAFLLSMYVIPGTEPHVMNLIFDDLKTAYLVGNINFGVMVYRGENPNLLTPLGLEFFDFINFDESTVGN
jgi:hypothetical protein